MSGVFGCEGAMRSCSNTNANSFGADWVVVQYNYDGSLLNCWELQDTSIANEESSDGIYWLSSEGHLVHISGFYNRVQVVDGKWVSAMNEIGIHPEDCR